MQPVQQVEMGDSGFGDKPGDKAGLLVVIGGRHGECVCEGGRGCTIFSTTVSSSLGTFFFRTSFSNLAWLCNCKAAVPVGTNAAIFCNKFNQMNLLVKQDIPLYHQPSHGS